MIKRKQLIFLLEVALLFDGLRGFPGYIQLNLMVLVISQLWNRPRWPSWNLVLAKMDQALEPNSVSKFPGATLGHDEISAIAGRIACTATRACIRLEPDPARSVCPAATDVPDHNR